MQPSFEEGENGLGKRYFSDAQICVKTKHGSKHVEEYRVSNIKGKQNLSANELIDGVEDDLQQRHDDQLQHGHLENESFLESCDKFFLSPEKVTQWYFVPY